MKCFFLLFITAALGGFCFQTSQFRKDVLDATNKYRREKGLGNLVRDSNLEHMAQNWADHLTKPENCNDIHHNPNLPYFVAENMALRGPTMSGMDAVRGWKQSPGHNKNMLRNRLTKIGVGRAKFQQCYNNAWFAVALYN